LAARGRLPLPGAEALRLAGRRARALARGARARRARRGLLPADRARLSLRRRRRAPGSARRGDGGGARGSAHRAANRRRGGRAGGSRPERAAPGLKPRARPLQAEPAGRILGPGRHPPRPFEPPLALASLLVIGLNWRYLAAPIVPVHDTLYNFENFYVFYS